MSHVDAKLKPSRFNKVGISGNRGSAGNLLDSFLVTYEFKVTAQTGSTTLDTGIPLPSIVQATSGYIIPRIAESTGLVKSFDIGFIGNVNNFFLSADGSVLTLQGPPLTGTSQTAGNTILITFGSDDWVEYEADVILSMLCVE